MKNNKTLTRLICTAICAVCLFVAMSAGVSAADDTITVRVGYFNFDGYHMQDENGNRSGYGYEILQHMAGYAGFQYEYVGYDKTWGEMQDMLANGEIDILTSAQKTDERLERFDFSTSNIGVSAAIVTVNAGDYTYQPDDYKNWNGIRIGMIEENSRNEGLEKFAAENGFVYEPVYFKDTDEMVHALKNKNGVDAILTSNLRRINGESIIAQFDSSQFYVMVRKGNTSLLQRVNYAIAQMDAYEPGFRTKLLNTYYPVINKSALSFSVGELDFINNNSNNVFTAIINPDRAPYSFLKDGALCGSMYDAALEIISRSGLNVRFVVAKDRAEYWQLVNEGNIDIRFDSDSNYNQAEKLGCWKTSSYLQVPIDRLYCEGTTSFDSVAVLRNSSIAYAGYPELQEKPVTYYDSVKEVANAILSGKQSMALLPENTATVAVRDDVTNRLVSEIVYGYNTAYAVSVSTKQSPLLFSVLQKAVSSMSSQDMDKFSQAYSDSLVKPFSVVGYIYDYPIRIFAVFIGIIFIIILILAIVFMARRRREATEQMQAEQLHNEKLKSALEQAKAADIAKSNFMSRMSHEIRTPLNAIIGYNTIACNDMSEAKTDAERRRADMKVLDCLSKSGIASKHLLTVINDVLDMSAIESGKIKIVKERFDFKGLVNSLTTVFYTQAKSKGVNLEVVFDSLTEEWFVGDQMRTNQILTNLLSNAIKFTSDGGNVQLTIFQPKMDEKTTEILFEVADTGIGMSPEYMERIWSPFEQADTSISRRFGGTGLGLSITKNLVDLMGGTIEVESTVGKGSTFRVGLTYGRTEQPVVADGYDFSKTNALVVDDDVSTCDYIRLLLNRFRVRSTAATSGEDAIAAFKEAANQNDPYTVCLVDWHMPKMDGIETIRRIHEIAGDDIPIIIITAYDYTEIADEAAQVGVSTFISKPLFQSSLFNLLVNMCAKTVEIKETERQIRHFSGERILLAEDNTMNMEIAKKILESAGLTVDGAWNGQEAVDMFTAAAPGTYKAILMDVQMPVMDGHQATRTIRACAHPQAKTIPIIAMTADAFAENVAEALDSGMNDHISKPIDVRVLFEKLAEYILKEK